MGKKGASKHHVELHQIGMCGIILGGIALLLVRQSPAEAR